MKEIQISQRTVYYWGVELRNIKLLIAGLHSHSPMYAEDATRLEAALGVVAQKCAELRKELCEYQRKG